MNRKQRTTINERYRMKWEKAFIPAISRALKSQIKSFVNDIRTQDIGYAQSRLTYQLLNMKMAIAIKKLYRVAGVDAANRELRKRRQEPMIKGRTFGFNEDWTVEIENYFRLHLYDKVVIPITEKTKADLLSKIQQMVRDGESVEWLVQQVSDDTFTRYRAERIAITESTRAVNFGQQLGAQKSKFKLEKEWVTVGDDRVRHTHILLDGKRVGEFEEFKPGLQFPGDPNGGKGETINCRCHLEYHALRDGRGRLIPKEPGGNVRISRELRREFREIVEALN